MIKNYCIEVPLNGITSLPNLMKIFQAVQKLVGDRQTHREDGDLTSLFPFVESRLIKCKGIGCKGLDWIQLA
jgi:hypothetical protein